MTSLKRWTKQEDLALVGAQTDAEMTALFPGLKLATLQRRRRLLRAQTGMSAGTTLGLMGLEETKYDPKNFSAFVVGDLQSPFHDTRALAAFNHCLADVLPDVLIDNGDHYDNFAISRYQKDPLRATPENFKREVEIGTSIFAEWRSILGADRDILLMEGNHEVRWQAYIQNSGMDKLLAIAGDKLSLPSLYGLDALGVTMVPYMKPTMFGDVVISHGATSSETPGAVVTKLIQKKYGRSVLVNHTHKGSLVVQRYLDRTCIGLENFAMCQLDELGYVEFPNWVQGFTFLRVVDGVTYMRPVIMVDQTFEFNGAIYTPEGKK